MAEIAVCHLLANIAPFFQGEVNLLSGFRDEIEFIRDEFERMSAFLRVADSLEERYPQLKVWVKQVREAAYDTRDVLDKFRLLFEDQNHGNGFRGFLGKISGFAKTLKARHQIASQLQRIKTRVINISKGHQRYHDRYHGMMLLEQGSSSVNVSKKSPSSSWYDSRGDALLLAEADLVGIHKPKSKLIGWLFNRDPRLNVHSVAGMGGLGKTTLVKRVFNDSAVKKHFQNQAWITVSQSFGIEKLLQSLIQQLFEFEEEVGRPVPQGVEIMDVNSLKGVINAVLQQKRYLLVLDDVWSIQAWQSLRQAFPDSNCGSRVILTTRNVDLASFSCKEYHGKVYHLQPLPRKESWTLFCRKAFQENSCPPHLEGFSRIILERCEGLPLAIVAIGGLLSTKEQSSVDEWERIYRSLGAELVRNDKLLSMNKILLLSYHDLPYYLKLCFLYLSIFPESSYLIYHFTLIQLLVAEGFVEVTPGLTAEEVAEGCVNELTSRSLIQVAKRWKDGSVKGYRIHDLWREIISSVSMEQNFVTIIAGCVQQQQIRLPDKVRRLSVRSGLKDCPKHTSFTQLRSLFILGGTEAVDPASQLAMLASSGGLRMLKLLDMESSPFEAFPNEVMKLVHLTYLNLSQSNIKTIPKWIGQLKNLETLDLTNTDVTELPDEILKLRRLRHLLVYRMKEPTYFSFHNENGVRAPARIGSLSSLEILHSIEANHGNVVREIGKLTQLRWLKILNLRRDDGKDLCSSLQKLNSLRNLSIVAAEEDVIVDLESLSSPPPPLLRTLEVEGRLEKLPHWLPSLHNLAHLKLRWSGLRGDPLQALQDLPNLVALGLTHAYEGERLCFRAGGFRRLKALRLTRLQGLRWVIVEDGSMSCLEELCIKNCEMVEGLPSGLEYLTHLKRLFLADMSDKLISNLNRDAQGGDYSKIAHVPRVWIGNSKDGCWTGNFI